MLLAKLRIRDSARRARRATHGIANEQGNRCMVEGFGRGTLTFATEGVGNPVAAYIHVAKFVRGSSSYSMSRQSTEELTRAEVEKRFADFISEIRHGQ
jgi:hypothetical protein